MRAQRGGAPIFLIFALTTAIAVGYGVYRVIKHDRHEAAIAEANAPKPRPAPPPREERVPEAEPMEPMAEAPPAPSLERLREGLALPPDTDRGLVAFGSPGIDGPLQRYRVEQAVKTQKSQFMRCVALEEDQLVGMVNITLFVGADGNVSAREISAGDAEFRKCVEQGIDRMRFDATDRPTTILYPIRFGRPQE